MTLNNTDVVIVSRCEPPEPAVDPDVVFTIPQKPNDCETPRNPIVKLAEKTGNAIVHEARTGVTGSPEWKALENKGFEGLLKHEAGKNVGSRINELRDERFRDPGHSNTLDDPPSFRNKQERHNFGISLSFRFGAATQPDAHLRVHAGNLTLTGTRNPYGEIGLNANIRIDNPTDIGPGSFNPGFRIL